MHVNVVSGRTWCPVVAVSDSRSAGRRVVSHTGARDVQSVRSTRSPCRRLRRSSPRTESRPYSDCGRRLTPAAGLHGDECRRHGDADGVRSDSGGAGRSRRTSGRRPPVTLGPRPTRALTTPPPATSTFCQVNTTQFVGHESRDLTGKQQRNFSVNLHERPL